MGVGRALGEEAAHLELRVDSGAHLAIRLEEEPVAEEDPGVRLLERGDAHLVVDRARERGVNRGAREAQLAGAERRFGALAHGAQQRAREVGMAEGAVEQAHAILAPHLGDRPRAERSEDAAVSSSLQVLRTRPSGSMGGSPGRPLTCGMTIMLISKPLRPRARWGRKKEETSRALSQPPSSQEGVRTCQSPA